MSEQFTDPAQARDIAAQGGVQRETPQYQAGLRSVRAGGSTTLAQQVRFYARMDQAMQAAPPPEGEALACKAGCAYCCHYHVYVYAAEALAIAEHLRTVVTPVREAIVQKLRGNVARTAGMNLDEHLHTNVACAFLSSENACGIYPVRPSACRKHHSFDVQPCIDTFENPQAPDLNPQSALHIGIAEGFQGASAMALTAEGFDHRRYEMSGAVLEALENKAAARRWKDGKVSFPTVRDRDETGGIDY
jgi:hypothetical protein